MSILVDIEKRFKGFNLKVQFESGEGVTGLLEKYDPAMYCRD